MLNGPFSPWPSFTEEEALSVQETLLSNEVNYWTGSKGKAFELEFADWCGVEKAVAVANGTVALDLIWKAMNIGPGDEVVVTPRTFLASVSSIINAGAIPVFADVDLDSQNITAASVDKVLSVKTRAILCVHLAGWPCDMDGLADLVSGREIALVEDCAQAHGALYKERPVGSLGAMAAWSFCQDKIMTTGGEGGMLTTNNPDLWAKAWAYKDHGKSYAAVHEHEHPPGYRWLHESFGTNFRMTEMQAAIGRIQLRRMPEWQASRQNNANAILDCANDLAIFRVPPVPEHIRHAWYKCYMFVRPDTLKTGWTRDRIIQEVVDRGVPCFSGSCSEVYLEKAFECTSYRPRNRLPDSRELGETSLVFLVHPTLTESEIAKTCQVLTDVAGSAHR